MDTKSPYVEPADVRHSSNDADVVDLATALARRWRILLVGPILAAATALGITYTLKPVFTAQTTFLPPQQQNSSSAALASLGALAGLAGGSIGMKSPAEQYISLLQSATISDRIIDGFKLNTVYDARLRSTARRELLSNVQFILGKKDGLISIEVDDTAPERAADIANQYVIELRRLTSELAITEAQQRRMFFEQQLGQARERLTAAQIALQASGFSEGVLRTEPKAAAEAYAKLRAEVRAAEVKIQTMRAAFSENAPELQQAHTMLGALRAQLSQLAASTSKSENKNTDYISAYREFKYQEALFDLFAKQFEAAKVDESKEGALIQVIDPAQPPDRKSKPKQAIISMLCGALTLLALTLLTIAQYLIHHAERNGVPNRWRAFRQAFRRS